MWFLSNIFLYVLLLLPLLTYLKNRPDNFVLRFLSNIFHRPAGIYLMALPAMFEAWLVNLESFPGYAQTFHGFWLDMICFVTASFLFPSRMFSGGRWKVSDVAPWWWPFCFTW